MRQWYLGCGDEVEHVESARHDIDMDRDLKRCGPDDVT